MFPLLILWLINQYDIIFKDAIIKLLILNYKKKQKQKKNKKKKKRVHFTFSV